MERAPNETPAKQEGQHPRGAGRGLLRGLIRLAPTWGASPLRRTVQASMLLLYLVLFFTVAWPYSAELGSGVVRWWGLVVMRVFLSLDPLVGITTALASRALNVALLGTGAVLLLGLLVPRGFCGYLCPLGTLIDLFDWGFVRRFHRLHITPGRSGRSLRFGLLALVLIAAAMGVVLAGDMAALPVLTRGLTFTAGRAQVGILKNWGMAWSADGGMYLSVALFIAVFLLGVVSPRFWCRYVCPSGAVFALFGRLRLVERKVQSTCSGCGRCAAACPFDAVSADFKTPSADCATCRTCAGACPTRAVHFGWRWHHRNGAHAKVEAAAARGISRRMLLAGGVGGVAAGAAVRAAAGPQGALLRPPGSVDEGRFLDLCVRCGACLKTCPGPALHPAGLSHGVDALWTPVLVPQRAGCHPQCNLCTLVCPTGAIVPLSMEEKRRARIGVAVIDVGACLPFRGERECQLCYDECEAAGYHAIEMRRIRLAVGDRPPGMSESEYEEMGQVNAPYVNSTACVGCGLCEFRCAAAVCRQQKLLVRPAVRVVGNRDRS